MVDTFINKNGSWNIIGTATGVNANAANIFTTWDPTFIDWSDITITPTDKWNVGGMWPTTTTDGVWPTTTTDGVGWWQAPAQPMGGCGAGGVIGGNLNNWSFGDNIFQLTKPKGVKPDVLMGFFSDYVHALLFVGDTGTYVIPFMERLGLIWIQHQVSKWTAYNKEEFCKFIDDSEAVVFYGKTLDKKETHKVMSEAHDE